MGKIPILRVRAAIAEMLGLQGGVCEKFILEILLLAVPMIGGDCALGLRRVCVKAN